ncbi:delta-class carbonic anhydrase [Rhodovulum sp. BSW8]|uniref:delta-class carbonic anhydrase n=1 Tax=Rhodovulum sp. BSW8 TaxID=2259645 RepID=UPI001FB25FA9|nr:delta-class carbonic anhydrase [Rhodovulum sp. BSW8]
MPAEPAKTGPTYTCLPSGDRAGHSQPLCPVATSHPRPIRTTERTEMSNPLPTLLAATALAIAGGILATPVPADGTAHATRMAAADPAAHGDADGHGGGHHGAARGTHALADGLCHGFGPQAPRDISMTRGSNGRIFNMAPPASELNLCNIHTHTNAEHSGPGFSISAGTGEHGGFRCNETASLTEQELKDPAAGQGAFHGAKPGDTIEVHWVYSSCDVAPGNGLGSCMSETCQNPQLRVEAQVFLLVNDHNALDFKDFIYRGTQVNGLHQPRALPQGTGTPVLYAGSTTGPKYTEATCSPLQVTWSVRPSCAKLDINSLYEWAAVGNVFQEDHSHGVRPLVTAEELLSPIR